MGIHITNNSEDNLNFNFKPKIATLKKHLAIWKQRSLSLKGKITIINNLALAPLIYCAILIDIPEPAIKEINNIIQNLIWDGRTSNISQKTLIQSIDKGVLKLCQFSTKISMGKKAHKPNTC